ncbi:unnamed protein product [Staurois parvus]|uniref:Uncharacterized protein n=1 Tax=Staurois parvus TaxID=386267 RepID=A0ABN9AYF4_9NEOB|nr:unnamed protein product [Staurois parvus]
MGPCTPPLMLCQARKSGSGAPFYPSSCCARPIICRWAPRTDSSHKALPVALNLSMGPCTASSCLLPRIRECHGSLLQTVPLLRARRP